MYDSDKYCPLFFKGMYAWVDGSESHVGHCCLSGAGKNTKFPSFNDPGLERTRLTWDREQRAGCYQCWDAERRGETSVRQHHVIWARDLGLDPVKPELLSLDFSVGSGCNAKCITCHAGSSTTWAAEDVHFGLKKHNHVLKSDTEQAQITSIDVSQLRQVYFTGGEPFMSHRLVGLLTHIKHSGNIAAVSFRANSNGSIYPSASALDLIKQCRTAEIFFSIDAVGPAFEYIRNPLKWSQVESNIKSVQQLGIEVKIAVTLGIHNIDAMPELYQWFRTLGLPDSSFEINKCHGTLGFDFASEPIKQVWRQKLSSLDQPWVKPALVLIADHGKTHDILWQRWLEMIDHRRSLSWKQQLPGLAESKNKADALSL